MPSPSQPPTDGRRPRAMVIDSAWRGLGPGPASLSGPGGAPLTRTVKLIVLPLIVRPALRPELAADFLDAPEAARLGRLIAESGPVLDATAEWFTLLKKTRRALGIVAGNPQDLYFQRCFELATEHGAPAEAGDAAAVARAVLADVADVTGGRTVEALRQWLSDPARRTRLDADLTETWARRERGALRERGSLRERGAEAGVEAGGLRETVALGETGALREAGAVREAGALREAVRAADAVLEACGGRGTGARRGRDARAASAADAGGTPGTEDVEGFASMVERGHGSVLGRELWAGGGD
ncbi:hypothetical protein RM877_34305, partial [Streptomyces sp. DSM 41981]|nr:hypothetical protein [Streptomyces sp. DSM 41981]